MHVNTSTEIYENILLSNQKFHLAQNETLNIFHKLVVLINWQQSNNCLFFICMLANVSEKVCFEILN